MPSGNSPRLCVSLCNPLRCRISLLHGDHRLRRPHSRLQLLWAKRTRTKITIFGMDIEEEKVKDIAGHEWPGGTAGRRAPMRIPDNVEHLLMFFVM